MTADDNLICVDLRNLRIMILLLFVSWGSLPTATADCHSPSLPDLRGIHIFKHLVLTTHRPDKAIGACAHTTVNGPRGREDDILLLEDQMTCLIGFAIEMDDTSVLWQIEIAIDLCAAIMGVGRIGIPYRTFG
jgi:hypothetical protein